MNVSSSFTYLLLYLFCYVTFLQQLPVITSNTIVRCRCCRTYINPFVTFLDQRRWKCNLCYRVNDGESSPELFFVRKFVQSRCFMVLSWFFLFLCCSVPEEFMYNPVTRSYGEPHKRPEVQNPTVEFIASSDYMVSHHCVSTRGQSGHGTATSTDRKKRAFHFSRYHIVLAVFSWYQLHHVSLFFLRILSCVLLSLRSTCLFLTCLTML